MRLFFNRWQSVLAADVLGAVFIAQRDMLKSFRAHVLAGSGMTPATAEIMIELYLAEAGLSSPGHADADGFISFRALLSALDYSPGLLSRRIAWLCKQGWVKTERAAPNIARGIHGNCQHVKITETGSSIAGPVWQRYEKLAERLLSGISPEELGAHYRINEHISFHLAEPKFWMRENAAPPEPHPVQRPARKSKLPSPPPEPLAIKIAEPAEQDFLD